MFGDIMHLIKYVLINLFITLLLLIVLELFFGHWISGPNYGFMNIPREISRKFDVSNLYLNGGEIKYSRDKHGLRGPYRSLSNIDILTLGGSTTNQLYIDDSSTWQAHMRQLFAKAGTSKVIVNASVDGQSTKGHIAVFEKWFPNIPKLKAKHILVYAGINDTNIESHKRFDEMESSNLLVKTRNWLANKSAIYNLFRTIRGFFRAHQAKLIHGSGPPFKNRTWVKYILSSAVVDVPSLKKRLEGFESRLKNLIFKIKSFGAKPIFVTQPTAEFRVKSKWIWVTRDSGGKINPKSFLRIKAFNQVTMNVCREAGAICIDLASMIEFQDEDFYDRIHSTPAGTKKIGLFLFEKLKDKL